MKAVKILGRFLAVLLAIVFGFVLLVLMLITFFKGIVDHDSIDKYVVVSEIVNTKTQEFFHQDSSDNKTFEQQICEDLSLIGISDFSTKKILESEEMDKILSLYVANYVNYILFDEEKPVLSGYLVTSVFKEKLVEDGNNLSIKQEEELTNYIYDITNKINVSVPSISDLENMGYDMNTLKLISGNIFSVSSIIILSVLLLVIYIFVALCLWSKLRAVKCVSISILIVGLIFIALCFLEVKLLNLFINTQGIIDGLILNIVNKSFQSLLIYGLSLIGVGIALIIISCVMIKSSKNKNDFKPIEIGKENDVKPVKDNLKDHIVTSLEDIDKFDTKIEDETKAENINNLEDIVDEAKEEIVEEEIKQPADEKVKEIEDIKESNALVVTDEKPNAVMITKEPKINEKIINDESIPEQEYNEKIKVQKGKEIPDISFVDEEDGATFVEKSYDYSSDDFDIDIVEVDQEVKSINEEPKFEKTPDKEMEVIVMENVDDTQIEPKEIIDDSKYIEIDDEDEEIIKKDKVVIAPKPIHIDIVSPVKGKDIKPVIDEEEEIELL